MTAPRTPMTRQERDVLELIAEGSSDPEIAEILGLTHDRVRYISKKIFSRLGARNRTNAVAVAYQRGLLRTSGPVTIAHQPTPPGLLTGAPMTDAIIPAAVQLIWAVRRNQPTTDAFRDAQLAAARFDGLAAHDRAGTISARALAIVLAAMVPDDREPSALLAWMRHPAEYLRLREAGFDAATSAAEASAYATSPARAGGAA